MIILSTKLRNAINRHANGMDLAFKLKNININGVNRGCSGFVRNNSNGSVIYVTTESPWRCDLKYMYRYADSEKDYTGYHNRWASELDQLADGICACLHSTPKEQNDRRF